MDSIENDLLVWNNLWRRSLEDEERKRVWSDYLSKCVGEDKGERLTFMMQLRMQERLVFPPGFPPNLNVKGKLEYLLWNRVLPTTIIPQNTLQVTLRLVQVPVYPICMFRKQHPVDLES